MPDRRRHTPRWQRDRCAARNRRGLPCPWLAREGGRFCGPHEQQADRRRAALYRSAWRVLSHLAGDRSFPSARLLRAQANLRRALRVQR